MLMQSLQKNQSVSQFVYKKLTHWSKPTPYVSPEKLWWLGGDINTREMPVTETDTAIIRPALFQNMICECSVLKLMCGCLCWRGQKRPDSVQLVQGSGSVSGLLAAPLVGHGPAKQLLHMTGNIHCVLQVKVSICIQHGVIPDRTNAETVIRERALSTALTI